MSVKVKDIMGVMEKIAPRHLAEGWDNVGLAIGDPEREVTKILVALDVIDPVVEEAKEIGAEMIVTHHPMLLFKKIESITTQNTLGKRIYNLIENGIAAFSAHTNLDIAKGGTNDVLAELAGLQNVPTDILEAARLDGANGVQGFFKITVPYMSSVIQTSVSMTIIDNFKQFPLFWQMTSGGPNGSTTTLAVLSYKEAFIKHNFGSGAAVTTIWMILMILFVFVYNKIFPKVDME